MDCEYCGKHCDNSMNLSRHKTKCLKDKEKKEQAKTNSETYCYCDLCDRKFSKRLYLDQHVKVCSASNCKKLTPTDENKVVKDGEKDKPVTQQYVCLFCKVLFQSEDKLSQHSFTCGQSKKESTGDNKSVDPYPVKETCAICGKNFHSVSNFSQHTKVCKLNCHICDFSFRDKKQFYNHKRSCTDKCFLCRICKKTFKRSDILFKHVKGHVPSVGLKCPVCSLDNESQKALEIHICESHTLQV